MATELERQLEDMAQTLGYPTVVAIITGLKLTPVAMVTYFLVTVTAYGVNPLTSIITGAIIWGVALSYIISVIINATLRVIEHTR